MISIGYKNWLIRPFLYAILIGILAFYYGNDPMQKGSLAVKCLFHYITGYSCIGCGSQRALYALLHGKLVEALRHNLLFVIFFPFILALYIQIVETYILRTSLKLPLFFSNVSGKWVFITVVLFTILRNLPWFQDYLSV